ncbi:MAG: hypothetical protein LBL95_04485 [Deltaproteobacteria bacterium]|nr:hypothetical protein [Deltaproteobacteria bacterium]
MRNSALHGRCLVLAGVMALPRHHGRLIGPSRSRAYEIHSFAAFEVS